MFLLASCVQSSALSDNERQISDCPQSPNCVSSTSLAENHRIAPLTFEGSPDRASQCLKEIIRAIKRTTIVVAEEGCIHAEFRTILGFVDDVEFQVDCEKRIVHMRSASRAGYWDLGVNRRRPEAIRASFKSGCN